MNLDRYVDCSNCGQPVPEELRKVIKNPRLVQRSQPVILEEEANVEEQVDKKRSSSKQANSSLNEALRPSFDASALIRAQDRTTYAIRSLALFFFISLQTSLFGGALIGMAVSNNDHYDSYGQLNAGATFFAVLGWLVAFAGFLIATVLGKSELNKSKP